MPLCLYPPLCVWDIPVFSLCADLRLIDCQRITWLSHDKYERKKGLLMLLMYWAIEPKAPRQQSICDMVYSVSAKKPKNSVYFHFSFYEPSLALCQTVYSNFRNYAPPPGCKRGHNYGKSFPSIFWEFFLDLFWLGHVHLGVTWCHRKVCISNVKK